MALIKGKQIQSLAAAKVVVSDDRQFVTAVEKTDFAAKATVEQVATAKGEAIAHADGVKTTLEASIEAVKAIATAGSKEYTDGEITKVTAAITAVDEKATTNTSAIATGLGERYTKEEVDNKLSLIASGIKYKGTVASYEEIATRFATPQEGWLVAVEATSKFYIYTSRLQWEEFPIEMAACTTHTKQIALTVTDNQTVIPTGIKTNGEGALQTSLTLSQEIVLLVNGFVQTKTSDYTVAVSDNQIIITWLDTNFTLEATDVVSVI